MTDLGFRSGLLLGAAALAVVCAFDASTEAQAPPLAHALHMTSEQADAMRRAWNDRLPYVPGEVLVKFRPGLGHDARVRALASAQAGVEANNARWMGDTLWIRATGEPDAAQLAVSLARQPEVEWAQPNYLRWTKAPPNDPSYSRQWNMDLIDMPRAWDINAGANDSMTIAVIDTGVTTTTQTFNFPLWTGSRIESVAVPFRVTPDISTTRILPGRDFIFWNGPVLDMVGHGTHVASTAVEETNNNVALAGIAYRAKLLPLKVCIGYWEIQIITSALGIPGYVDPRDEGGCSVSGTVQAIRFAADNNAQVANLSIGGVNTSPAELEAVRYAVGRGTFVAMAVGNEFEEGNPTEYPAAYGDVIDGAMSVGAVGRSSQRAFYSNTGAHLEIVAPGGSSRDGGAAGFVFQTTLLDDDFDPFTIIRPRFERYVEAGFSGTSMATPHVAGVAALLYSQGITSPAAIEAAIERFARDLGAAGRDPDFGHGLIDARTSLRGFGVVR